MPSTGGARHAIERTPKLIDVSIIFRKSWWWGNVDLPVVSISGEKVSLHECLTDIYVVTKHMMLGSQGENCAETSCMWHRAESIFSYEMAPFLMPLDRDTERSPRTRVLADIAHR